MKKFFISIICLITFASSVFAIPYFSTIVKDEAGEFVYYRDFSFLRESYIGLLAYDDTTLQVKYYAPSDPAKNLAEKEIAILVTIDPETSYMKLTGEKIISEISPDSEDVDIVNYLHDILYEFNSHKVQETNIPDQTWADFSSLTKKDFVLERKLTQQYDQFGGIVEITYNPIIPLFNISQIKAPDGSIALSCVTIGKINSSDDKTFDAFKGIPEEKAKKSKGKLKAKKASEYTYENQKISLGTEWKRVSDASDESIIENLFVLDTDAFISLNEIPSEYVDNIYYLLRKLIQSSDNSIGDFKNSYIKYDAKTSVYEIYIENYNQKNNSKLVKIIKLSDSAETKFSYVSLAVFKNAYDANVSYFRNILKSWGIN
ncbi:MAG: hypothetical protein K6A89_07905 [Treponema sp.]|nr:hypothetical protein [Treponema sp.]